MRITVSHLRGRIDTVNALLGHPDPQWNTVGAVHLYRAYGATGVHRIVSDGGAVDDIMPLGTVREANEFLRGMIVGLQITAAVS